ncbi:hypothetical protein Leryth_020542 [Lithospermum erythrorhizon]|nr:hypothetical protein Leryth_020542 [Lithospermum erythrorhizon]
MGATQSLYVIGKIIYFCVSQKGHMDYAKSLFEEVEFPDGFLLNTMIRGFVWKGNVEKAFEYFKKMRENGEGVNNFALSFLLKLCGQFGTLVLGNQLHSIVIKCNYENHSFVRNSLVHMYGMLKDIGLAYQVFDEITVLDTVNWNTIIHCYVHCGRFRGALTLFDKMQECGVGFDDATLVVVLSACSGSGALEFGKRVHSLTENTRFFSKTSVSNAFIDMYAKCGVVIEGFKIFNEMKQRDIVTWNTMISAFAMNGYAFRALELFSRMLDEKGVHPDGVTFLGVLCACGHGGMVEDGRRYFQLMINKYHIEPTIKHYGCMVDMLGRAGFVAEAYELIISMPMECNAIVYRTLLAACRMHGEVELGEKVRDHLLGVEPEHSSDYVLLSNIYASADQWKEMAKERKSMSDRRVQKPMPGNSNFSRS